MGRVSGAFGMGVAARALVAALTAGGVDVAIADLEGRDFGRRRDVGHLRYIVDDPRDLPFEVTLWVDSPTVIEQMLVGRPETLAGRYNAIVPFWELTRVPASWGETLARMQTVFAPTSFVAGALAASYPARIRPLPVTPVLPALNAAPARDGRFRVFTTFDVLSAWERKNPEGAAAAFGAAFGHDPGVELIVKAWGASGEAPYAERARALVGGRTNVRFIDADLDYEAQIALLRSCDVYLALHRAEGLGLGALEAMSCGIPPVVTDYSGTADFVDETCGMPVPYTLVAADAADMRRALAGGDGPSLWAEPDVDAAARALVRLREDAALREDLGAHAARRVAERRAAMMSLHWLDHIAAALAQRTARREPAVAPPAAAPLVVPRTPVRAAAAHASHDIDVLLEGEFRTTHSMGHINREIGERLARVPGLRFAGVSHGAAHEGIALSPELEACMLDAYAGLQRRPQIRIWHLWPPRWERRNAERYIVAQPWEFGEIPVAWRDALLDGRVDGAWAYTRYVQDMYVRAGIAPERVPIVPLGIDPEILRPDGPRTNLATGRAFNFLFVGGTIGRKGIDVLVNTYLSTFRPEDDVALVIKDGATKTFYRGQHLGDELRAFAARNDVPKIVYLDEEVDDRTMAALYRSCHALVHPYRGEGFGMPILEAMACGLPVIVTAGGAADDFVDADVGIPIGITGRNDLGIRLGDTELVAPGWSLEPSARDLADAMMRIAADAALARRLGAAGSARARTQYGWDVVAERFRTAFAPLAV